MKKITIAVAVLSLLGVASCKKDDKGSGGKSGMLTNGKWQLTSETYQRIENGVAGPIDDNYPDMEACEKDDFVLFTAQKVIVTDEGPTKCDATDPQQTTQGQWSLIEGDTKMRQSSVLFGNEDWTIEQLDDKVFRISYTFVNGTTQQKSTSTYKNIN